MAPQGCQRLARRAPSRHHHRAGGRGPGLRAAREVCRLFQPYLGALYLDHGYHFFAPEPAESTLLAYVAEREDGTVVRGRIPDRTTQPRLLYHRYFMLTEHMSDAPEDFEQLWHESYAQHIAREQHATQRRPDPADS